MLKKIIADKSLEARAIVAFYPANSDGDDIIVYDEKDVTKKKSILYGLRQQAEVSQERYQCISDFVAPVSSGKKDFVGMFAVSAGFGCKELCER